MEETNRLAPWSPFKLFIDFYSSDAYWFQHRQLVKSENYIAVQSYIFEQALKQLHGDEYSLEFDGRPLISYFRLNESINLLDDYSPFIHWLHNEGMYLKDRKMAASMQPF